MAKQFMTVAHAHVVTGDPVHAGAGKTCPAENIATTNDDGDLCA